MPIPNNIADAAAAVRDGSLGLITVAKIGDLVVSALTDLSATLAIIPTRKPIAAGYTVTDAAVDVPQDLSLTICLSNPQYSADAALAAAMTGDVSGLTETWRDKRDQLKQMLDDREIVTVQTHEGVYESMLVTMIDPIFDVDENADAYFAYVSCTKYRQIETGAGGGLLDKAKESVGGL
jgi:hypothetical protein